MLLTETYKNRLQELAGIKTSQRDDLLKEIEDLYANTNKRVKFDLNLMKQAIEGGLEIGMVFQSNNTKYKMPVWKMRVIQPVAMGYDKDGQLIIRGIHVEGQSEKKAIETGVRSAQAKNEWRLFKASNIKSMFFTGRLFDHVSLGGYNPNDSAMRRIIISFDPSVAAEYQKQLKVSNAKPEPKPTKPPVEKKPVAPPVKTAPVAPQAKMAPVNTKSKEDTKALQQKIDKLNRLK